MAQDSPLSITASVIGILTFAIAILIGLYARTISVRNTVAKALLLDEEIRETLEEVVASFSELKWIDTSIQNSSDEPRRAMVEIYLLSIKAAVGLCRMTRRPAFLRRVFSFELKRQLGEIKRMMGQASSLRWKIYYAQFLRISSKIEHLDGMIQQEFRDLRANMAGTAPSSDIGTYQTDQSQLLNLGLPIGTASSDTVIQINTARTPRQRIPPYQKALKTIYAKSNHATNRELFSQCFPHGEATTLQVFIEILHKRLSEMEPKYSSGTRMVLNFLTGA